jgi:hypothetical protein
MSISAVFPNYASLSVSPPSICIFNRDVGG